MVKWGLEGRASRCELRSETLSATVRCSTAGAALAVVAEGDDRGGVVRSDLRDGASGRRVKERSSALASPSPEAAAFAG
jgi:hypothetical protein